MEGLIIVDGVTLYTNDMSQLLSKVPDYALSLVEEVQVAGNKETLFVVFEENGAVTVTREKDTRRA